MSDCQYPKCEFPAGPNGYCFTHRIYAGAKGKSPGLKPAEHFTAKKKSSSESPAGPKNSSQKKGSTGK